MKNAIKDMTPEEYFRHIHSKRNINGHIRLHLQEVDKALCHARGLCGGESLDHWGKHIVQDMENIKSGCTFPEGQEHYFQSVDWTLAQVVKEASDIIKHAGELAEYMHGARAGNQTLCNLRSERAKAIKEKRMQK
jgi:hypothetical protein